MARDARPEQTGGLHDAAAVGVRARPGHRDSKAGQRRCALGKIFLNGAQMGGQRGVIEETHVGGAKLAAQASCAGLKEGDGFGRAAFDGQIGGGHTAELIFVFAQKQVRLHGRV